MSLIAFHLPYGQTCEKLLYKESEIILPLSIFSGIEYSIPVIYSANCLEFLMVTVYFCIGSSVSYAHIGESSDGATFLSGDNSDFEIFSDDESTTEQNSLQDLSESFCSFDESVDLDIEHPELEIVGGPFSTPLYEGADITVFESYLLAFQYATRHSLTKKAFEELLQLISIHIPPSAQAPRSVYQLKRFFCGMFPSASPTIHYYCTFCQSKLTEQESNCTTNGCPGKEKGQFISVPLGPQIKRIMEGICMQYL